jgi:hypothetical protein
VAGSCGRFLLVLYLPPPQWGGLFNYLFSLLLPLCRSVHWPCLTEDAIHKHLKLTPATAMGHMNQRRQIIRYTSKTLIADAPTDDTELGTKTHLVYAVLVDQGQLYTDLTGKFPVRSSKGNSYAMVCYVMTETTLKSSQCNLGPPQNGSRSMIPSIRNSRSRVSNQNSKLSTTRCRPI